MNTTEANRLLGQSLDTGSSLDARAALDAGANPGRQHGAITPFVKAAGLGRMAILSMMLSTGVDVNHTTGGETALHAAVKRPDCLDLVRLLVRHGCDPNRRDSGGLAPLEAAVSHGNLDVVRLLIRSGARLIEAPTVLHRAARLEETSVLGFLIEQGARVGTRDDSGRTPLFSVRSVAHAELLVERGADCQVTDHCGNTVLHDLRGCEPGLVRFFASRGVDVNAMNHTGARPLHCAAMTGALRAAQELVSHGADVRSSSYRGSTPLQLALLLASAGEPLAAFLRREGDGNVARVASRGFDATPRVT